MSEWQPIETAPKSGRAFLVASGQWLTVGCWNKHRNAWCTIADTYPPYRPDEQPTHWMPLPTPPPPHEEEESDA